VKFQDFKLSSDIDILTFWLLFPEIGQSKNKSTGHTGWRHHFHPNNTLPNDKKLF